ncbi:metallophosphoesterase family protein [Dietzia sp. PP-33]|jgi:DNA repair exonuclease SbcCD nuclease subunit|uniref:metallophosphoesterase family protein n=1 Tax=Dietzia sp. PP-33 TaxID=2957500 RepID=UPI0029B40B6A|nr:metallophosphoesterase [Dietzia sp. PP-33]MDX2355744.1 metallophosphoesterase [Dietzia sp. PP-33]
MDRRRNGDVIRFLHSADWQLGMTRRFLGTESQAVYTADRLAAVASLGELATEYGAGFVVVAGDAFEDNAVPRSVVLRAAEALAAFPVPVLVLPGNHDPLDVSSVLRCRDFSSAVHGGAVTVLEDSEPVEVLPGVEVVGVPWTSKRPDPARLPALLASLGPTDGLRVLVAHGGTDEVYGGDAPSVEAIRVADLEDSVGAGHLDYVALGDRHSVTRVGSGNRIWFSGSPETTAFDDVEKDSGHALLVELGRPDATGSRVDCAVTPVRTGRWSFRAINAEIETEADLEALSERVEAVGDKSRTVLKLGLTGTVGVALRARIDDLLDTWAALFAAAYLRERLTHLVVRAEDSDFTDLVDGYAGRAVEDLVEAAASDGPDAEDAGNALSLLYRLVDGGVR